MLYASELFRMQGTSQVGLEDRPDDIPDVIAEILVRAVEERVRRQLGSGYRWRNAVVSRVRGRIDVLETERRQWLARGLVACRFEELTIDVPRNRYVRAALETISRLVRNPDIERRCRTAANCLKMLGVSGHSPTPTEIRRSHSGRNERDDQFMVAAAHLVFELAIPTEESGTNTLSMPNRDEFWMRQLFERAIGGFYDVVLRPRGWRVRRGGTLRWNIDHQTAGIKAILPTMRTDIVLDKPSSSRRIVIDTKFTSILTRGWYKEESLRSGYLYQIYAYLHSQVGRGECLADHAEGLLLHPSIGQTIDETVVIQAHRIRFATVDLMASTAKIRERLLVFCEDT
jgi:5-methylcytosine-specific restriction enzyme subunit McrC